MNGNAHDCERFDELLPEYLEGELEPASAATFAAEAGDCERCSAVLAELAAIRREAATLPERQPGRDLWQGIEARIAPEVIPIGRNATAAAARAVPVQPVRRYTHPAWLAAAAVILVIVTAAITWYVAAPDDPYGTGQQLAGSTTTPGSFVIASIEQPYADQIEMLHALVQQRRTELDSSTVAVIEQNLTIIERAVAESRAALARDTTSRFLRDQLNEALSQKVELLRTAAMLPASST